jgi:hypothetical protein
VQVELATSELANDICEGSTMSGIYSISSLTVLNGAYIDCFKNVGNRVSDLTNAGLREADRVAQSVNENDRSLAISEDCSKGGSSGGTSENGEGQTSSGAFQVTPMSIITGAAQIMPGSIGASIGNAGGEQANPGTGFGEIFICGTERVRTLEQRLAVANKAITDGISPDSPGDADPASQTMTQFFAKLFQDLLTELQNVIFKFLEEMINRAISFIFDKISEMFSAIPFLGPAISNFVNGVGNLARTAVRNGLSGISDNTLPDELKARADQTICGRTIYPPKDGTPLEEEIYNDAIDPRFIEYCNSQNKPINVSRSFFDTESCKDANASADTKYQCEIRGFTVPASSTG